MKLKRAFQLSITVFLFCACAWAQPQNPPARPAVTDDELQELIETLESETARKEFISELKTLLKLHEEQRTATRQATEEGSIKARLELIQKDYRALLRRYGLDSSLLGRIVVSIAAFGCAVLLMILVRISASMAQRRLHRVKDRFALDHARFEIYIRLLRYAGYLLSFGLLLYALGLAWQVTDFKFLGEGSAGAALAALLHIILILGVAAALWEIFNTLIEQAMRKADGNGGNRMRTLLPIARNFLLLVLICLFTLVILSEVGVDIMPLLAGAGIFGIALGFGAQTFVKDLLTGFTIIFEDLIQVGDVIKVAGHTGAVERITIRKIQLRDSQGIVYTVPFSEISTLENWTKDFSFYVMDIAVSYREDAGEVEECLREIDESIRQEDPYRGFILEPLEIMGVDRFEDSAMIIKARVKTIPAKQWTVGREFNRRIKLAFDEKGIEMPLPSRTLYFGEGKNGAAAPLRVLMQGQKPQAD
ncbi:MAG TPA: mechanosensitive ion channel domain-containing protein [Gammaproteobacteria bacterium]|nr:mechanosensitive ion channel domain-containing protein [Gammaproteobacteria bacterium]